MIAIEPKHWLGLNGMTMKYKFTGIALGLAIAAGAQAQTSSLNFLQLQNHDISTRFDGSLVAPDGFRWGNSVSNVVSDGTDLFIAGVAATTGDVSVVRVSNWLTNTPSYTRIFTTNAFAGGRMSKLAYNPANSSLYFGFGLGEAHTGGANGLVKMSTSGVVDTAFSGGVLLGNELTVSGGSSGTRIDSFDVDPLTGRLFAVAFNNGLVYSVDGATGAPTGTYNATTAGGNRTQWRDISVTSNGQVFGRSIGSTAQGDTTGFTANIVQTWSTRVDPTLSAGTLSGHTKYYSASTTGNGNATATSKMLAVAGADIDSSLAGTGLVMYNDQTTLTGDPNFRRVVIRDTLTGTQLFTLDGTEQNGMAGTTQPGSRFADSGMSLGFTKSGGRNFVLVAESNATRDTLRVYEVVPEPASMIAVGVGAAALLRRRKKTA